MPNRLVRYIECRSGGQPTGRMAYAIGNPDLFQAMAQAEWQIDPQFSAADEILRDPSIKAVFSAAITDGVKVVVT